MYIYNTEIHPSAAGAEVIPNGYVRIENGRIAALGRGMPDRLSLNSDDIDAGGFAFTRALSTFIPIWGLSGTVRAQRART